MFVPSMVGNKAFQEWWGRFERLGAAPAACMETMRLNSEIDVSPVLSSIHVPTLVIHRTDDVAVIRGGRELAALIPSARYVEFPGSDHIPFIGDNSGEIIDAIEELLTGLRTPVTPDRVLATVLFTDIVGSTEKAAMLGDRRWRDLLDEHDKVIRTELARFRGREVKSLDDGFRNIRRTGTRHSLRKVPRHRAAISWTTDLRGYSHRRSRNCGGTISGASQCTSHRG